MFPFERITRHKNEIDKKNPTGMGYRMATANSAAADAAGAIKKQERDKIEKLVCLLLFINDSYHALRSTHSNRALRHARDAVLFSYFLFCFVSIFVLFIVGVTNSRTKQKKEGKWHFKNTQKSLPSFPKKCDTKK